MSSSTFRDCHRGSFTLSVGRRTVALDSDDMLVLSDDKMSTFSIEGWDSSSKKCFLAIDDAAGNIGYVGNRRGKLACVSEKSLALQFCGLNQEEDDIFKICNGAISVVDNHLCISSEIGTSASLRTTPSGVSCDLQAPFKLVRKIVLKATEEGVLVITNTSGALSVESQNVIADGVRVVVFRGFEGVTEITPELLANSDGVEHVHFGYWDSLQRISGDFLHSCIHLTSVDVSNFTALREIDGGFLSGCSALQKVTLMDMTNVKRIGTDFMKGCSALTTVNGFKVSKTTIFEGNFLDGCTSLEHCDLSSATSLKEENLPEALSAQSKRHPTTMIFPRHLIVVELPKFTSNIAEFHQALQQLPAHILESDASQLFHEILRSSASCNNFVQWMAYLRLYLWFINAIPADKLLQLRFKEADHYTPLEGGKLYYVPLTPTLSDVLMLYADFKLFPMMPVDSSTECRNCAKVPKTNLYYSRQYDFGVESSLGTVLRTPALLRVVAIASASVEPTYQYMSSPYTTMFQRNYVADEPLNFAAVTGDPNTLAMWSELLEFHKIVAAHNLETASRHLMGEAFKESLQPLGFTIDNDYPANFKGTMCGKVVKTEEPIAIKRVAKPEGNDMPAVYKEWKEIDDIHIIPLRFCDVVAEHIIVVTPWAENRSLKDFANHQLHPQSEGRVRPFFRQALKGLRVLQERGLCHGNIKLSNLIMFDGNSIKLTDMVSPPGNLDQQHSQDIKDLATAMMQMITLKLKKEDFGPEDWAATTPDFKNLMNACLVTGGATAHQLLTENRWMEDRRQKAAEDPDRPHTVIHPPSNGTTHSGTLAGATVHCEFCRSKRMSETDSFHKHMESTRHEKNAGAALIGAENKCMTMYCSVCNASPVNHEDIRGKPMCEVLPPGFHGFCNPGCEFIVGFYDKSEPHATNRRRPDVLRAVEAEPTTTCPPLPPLYVATKNIADAVKYAYKTSPQLAGANAPDVMLELAHRYAKYIVQSQSGYDGLDVDMVMAIHIMTQYNNIKFGQRFNNALRSPDRDMLKPFESFLFFLLRALKYLRDHMDLMQQPNDVLFKRVSMVNVEEAYRKDELITWWGVCSCMPQLPTDVGDLPPAPADSHSVFFRIESRTAVDISRFSACKHVREFMLFPGTRFRVTGVDKMWGGRYEVRLQETTEPPACFKAAPQIFSSVSSNQPFPMEPVMETTKMPFMMPPAPMKVEGGDQLSLLTTNEDKKRCAIKEEEGTELMAHVTELRRHIIQFDVAHLRREKETQTRNLSVHWVLKCIDAVSAVHDQSAKVDPNTFFQICRMVRELMDIVQSPKHLILMFRVIQRYSQEDSMHIFCQKTAADQLLRLGTYYNECDFSPMSMMTDRLYGAALRAVAKLKEQNPSAGESMSSSCGPSSSSNGISSSGTTSAAALLATPDVDAPPSVLYCTLTLKEICGEKAIEEHLGSKAFLDEVERRDYVYYKCSQSRLESRKFDHQSILALKDFMKTRSEETSADPRAVVQLYGAPRKGSSSSSSQGLTKSAESLQISTMSSSIMQAPLKPSSSCSNPSSLGPSTSGDASSNPSGTVVGETAVVARKGILPDRDETSEAGPTGTSDSTAAL